MLEQLFLDIFVAAALGLSVGTHAAVAQETNSGFHWAAALFTGIVVIIYLCKDFIW